MSQRDEKKRETRQDLSGVGPSRQSFGFTIVFWNAAESWAWSHQIVWRYLVALIKLTPGARGTGTLKPEDRAGASTDVTLTRNGEMKLEPELELEGFIIRVLKYLFPVS